MFPARFAAPVFEGAHWGHHGFAGYPVADRFLAEPYYNHYGDYPYAAAEVDNYLDFAENDFADAYGYGYAPYAHGIRGHYGYPMDLTYLKGTDKASAVIKGLSGVANAGINIAKAFGK